ncbi:MAG: pseudouridine synthase [Thaumarchaeota archaeon]|nr:MAG: pseudouridine synthase [Nitrososphaerota archaeon]HDD66496.1 pseudouridine synthase [Nitrososphaeria archaeon]
MDTSRRSPNLLKIVRDIADFQFGRGVGGKLFPDECRVEVSKRTGRPRYVYLGEELLATIRYPDNLIALSLEGARRLRSALGENAPRAVVRREAVDKVLNGLNLAPRDISFCSPSIRPGDEVVIEDEDGRILAVGRAVVSAQTMMGLSRGTAVKLRRILKT